MNFFRAEGGLFQFVAHSSAAEQHNYLLWFFERSYHGHFTPIGFWLEFKTIQLAGTCEAFWRWRQLVMLTSIAVALFVLVRKAAISLGASNYAGAAVAVVAIFIYQPFMSDLLSWTFLVFQLVWILFSALALFSLLKLALDPAGKRWIWASVIFAYASMHALGLGLATVAATALVLAVFVFGIARGKLEAFRTSQPTISLALSLLIVLSLAHALCMILLNGPPAPGGSRTLWNSSVPILRSFGFVALDFFSAVQSLFVSGIFALPGNETITAAWPFGLGISILAAVALFYLARTALRAPDSRTLTMFVLHAFSIASFFVCVGLIVMRETLEPSPVSMGVFLIGSRYLVPTCFTLLGSLTAIFSALAARARAQAASLFLLVAVCMFLTNYEYRVHLYPKQFPRNQISHGEAWKLIKATAQECRAAQLPIPNIPLTSLAQEFHQYDLRLFEPLLHDELNLPASERCKFVEWQECRGPARPRYEQAAPSLNKVIAMLNLEPAPAR